MAIELTPQQLRVLDGGEPGVPRVVDPRNNSSYVLVSETEYETVRRRVKGPGVFTLILMPKARDIPGGEASTEGLTALRCAAANRHRRGESRTTDRRTHGKESRPLPLSAIRLPDRVGNALPGDGGTPNLLRATIRPAQPSAKQYSQKLNVKT